MPIYAYRCTGCGHELDVLQKVSDPPLTDCPSCHRPSLAKKVTAAGFQLKGSGWYATDFRDKGAAKKDAKAAEPAGNGESKGDAKPATETASKPVDAASKPAESASPAPAPAPAASPPPSAT